MRRRQQWQQRGSNRVENCSLEKVIVEFSGAYFVGLWWLLGRPLAPAQFGLAARAVRLLGGCDWPHRWFAAILRDCLEDSRASARNYIAAPSQNLCLVLSFLIYNLLLPT
jgi:hypothetical protein